MEPLCAIDAENSPGALLAPLTVLYVKDERDVRKQSGRFLRPRCCKLLMAGDGRQGLKSCCTARPLGTTDLLMPAHALLADSGDHRPATPATEEQSQ